MKKIKVAGKHDDFMKSKGKDGDAETSPLTINDILLSLPSEQMLTNIDEVFNHPLNPRRGDVVAIETSIKENGYYPSVFIQKATSFVIKGNHTVKALKNLNISRKYKGKFQNVLMNWVDVDDQLALRIMLKDNTTSDESSYDTEVLYKALKETDESSPLGLYGTGFDEHIYQGLERQMGVRVDELDMTKEERQKKISEETGRAIIDKEDVPDAIFPSNNDYGIPDLMLNHCADFIDAPILAWGGQRGRKGKGNVGTYHFYTTDSHLNPIWGNPSHIVNTVVKVITEMNFSIFSQMPKAVVLYKIYQKRWLARYLQSQGIKILVDLYVPTEFLELGFIGVPKGWDAYSLRGSSDYVKDGSLDERVAFARKHAGKDIKLLVVGGSKTVSSWAKTNGFVWCPDEMAVARGAADNAITTYEREEQTEDEVETL